MPRTMEELMKRVDALMYSAKSRGKNTVTFDVYSGETITLRPTVRDARASR
jgi:hypothetical protein